MNVRINGAEVSRELTITSATCYDRSGGKADSCELRFMEAGMLSRWGIEHGMSLEIEQDGYSTGIMTIDDIGISPEGYGILRARSLWESAAEAGYGTHEDKTLWQIVQAGAAAMGMDCALYGLDGMILLRRIECQEETWPHFLERMLEAESAILKVDNGRLLAIAYDWVFAQAPSRTYRIISPPQKAAMDRQRVRLLTAHGRSASGSAEDTGAAGSVRKIKYGASFTDEAQAKRWAKGWLMQENLARSTYPMRVELDTGIAALSRINLTGDPWAEGSWFAKQVTHDLIQRTTQMELQRCITTIQ